MIEDTKYIQQRALWQNMALCASSGHMRNVLKELIGQMVKVNAKSRLTGKSLYFFCFQVSSSNLFASHASSESQRCTHRAISFRYSSAFTNVITTSIRF